MGVITPDKFNPIKAYCNVRLQQGVPLVDADVNELDDVRKFELRAFLKWFVGNGIPDGNDGFRVVAATTAAPDDFRILAGAQLPSAAPPAAPSAATNEFVLQGFGRCIVDGLDVIIAADTTYKGQMLSAVDLAPPYSLPPIAAVPVPNTPAPVLVYLDVWERIVSPTEDPSLIVPPLGTESCARVKRFWAVRTRIGNSLPVNGDFDFVSNHLYYGLASIARHGNPVGLILATDITDLRERGLSIPPSTLVSDVLGVTPQDYRRGYGRPAISFRSAIDAMLRGEMPGSPEIQIGNLLLSLEFGTTDLQASVADAQDGTLIFWSAGGNATEVNGFRVAPDSTVTGPVLIVSGGGGFPTHPCTAQLPTGDVLLAYTNQQQLVFRRGANLQSLASAAEHSIVPGSRIAYAVASGDSLDGGWVTFFTGIAGPWTFRRLQYGAGWPEPGTWLDTAPVTIPAPQVTNATTSFPSEVHAAVDSTGQVWAAATFQANVTSPPSFEGVLQVVRLSSQTAPAFMQPLIVAASNHNLLFPFVVGDIGNGVIWVFYVETFSSTTGVVSNIKYQRYDRIGGGPTDAGSVPGVTGDVGSLTARITGRGTIWLFWQSAAGLMSATWNPATNGWGAVRVVARSGPDSRSGAIVGPLHADQSVSIFWRAQVSPPSPSQSISQFNLSYRKLYLEL